MDSGRQSETLELDEIDMLLVKELELDARQGDVILARKLGVTRATVKRRTQRLLDARAITITAVVDAMALGFKMRGLIGITAPPGQVDLVVDYLKTCDSVWHVAVTTGRYNILVFATFRSIMDLMVFVEKELGQFPSVITVEIMLVMQSIKQSWSYLNGVQEITHQKMQREPDELELALIKALTSNPRENTVNLAGKLGIHRTTIAKTMQRLIDDNLLKIRCISKPRVLGFKMEAIIFLRIPPGKTMSVAKTLATDKRIHQIHAITGDFRLFVWCLFRDSRELNEFIAHDLGSVPDILSYEIMVYLRPAKLRFPLFV